MIEDRVQPRYVTLRDYLRVLRDYRILIALLALAGCGGALLASLRADPVYEATASIAFRDETRDLEILGQSTPADQSATQLAASKAPLITRSDVISRAQRALDGDVSTAELGGSISTEVDPNSALARVIARAEDPELAAAMANAVARAATAISNKQTRARFASVAQALRQETQTQLDDAADTSAAAFYAAELARLESLSRFARSAEVADDAGVPGSPVSPNRVRDGILGLVAGLVLGVLVAFFRDSLDRRLRGMQDIQSQFKFPVIGVVRDESMGKIPYLENGSNGDAEHDLEAFRIMRRNLDFLQPEERLRTIVVTSAFPEEGKTTVSSSLAFVLAVAGRRILLVESDLRRPVLAGRLGVEPRPGLSDFLTGQASPRDVLRTVRFTDRPSANGSRAAPTAHDLIFIPAGSPTSNAAELLGSPKFEQFIAQVSKAYDVVIIDSSPLLPVADTLELLPHVDGVIVCARELQTTREAARAAKATLDHFPERPTGLVVTGVRPREAEYEGYAYAYTVHSGA